MSDLLTLLPIRLRDARGSLSQHELGRRSGVHEKTISSFETGERIGAMKVSQLEKIAAACGVTPAALLEPPQLCVTTVVFEPPPKPPGPRAGIPALPIFRNRGVTLYRSSDHFGSSLGEPRR
jgi:transcriptional regulator with XRE-family HTH domain